MGDVFQGLLGQASFSNSFQQAAIQNLWSIGTTSNATSQTYTLLPGSFGYVTPASPAPAPQVKAARTKSDNERWLDTRVNEYRVVL